MQELNHFAAQLKRSQLVPESTLRAQLRQFQQSARAQGKRTADLTVDQLCDFLLKSETLTAWQVEKLRAGKFRGFHLGKYTLLDILGTGGMSVVYLAENRVLSQKRAIKLLPKSRVENSSYLARFYKEARAAAALDHPNIVKTFDIDSQGDQHFMVMEYVDGQDLSRMVKQGGPLPIATAMEYLAQASLALSYAHQNGLIHRDVKPSNFLLAHDGQIKLMDLGLAKTNDDNASLTVMHNETLMGTADYLSPEQALNSHDVDHRTDIYSLGGTLYFLIAGHPPFPEGSIAQRLAKHQSIDPPALDTIRTDCPPLVAQLCQWLMQKKPADRCQDCQQVVDAVRQWQQDPQAPLSGFRPPAQSAATVKSDASPPASRLASPEPPEPSNRPQKPVKPPKSSHPNNPNADRLPPTDRSPFAIDVTSSSGSDIRKAGTATSPPESAEPPLNRPRRAPRSRQQQALILLGSLLLILILAAAFLIWAFFFYQPTVSAVVN